MNDYSDWSSRMPLAKFDVAALISGARRGDQQSIGELLQNYRCYLMLLASSKIHKRLQPRVSPSDIVQETMLKAHRRFAQFRGYTEPELLAWLRQILISNLASFVERHMLAEKRDIRREVSLEPISFAADESATRLPARLAANSDTPSVHVQRRENAAVLAKRLAQLPRDYRQILVLRNVEGLSFEEAAVKLDRSLAATRMLWLRAIERLREIYRKAEQYGP